MLIPEPNRIGGLGRDRTGHLCTQIRRRLLRFPVERSQGKCCNHRVNATCSPVQRSSKIENLAQCGPVVPTLKEFRQVARLWSPDLLFVFSSEFCDAAEHGGAHRTLRLCFRQAVGNRIDVAAECVSIHQKCLERRRTSTAERIDYEIARPRQFVHPSLDESFGEHREVGAQGVESVPHPPTCAFLTASDHRMQRLRIWLGSCGTWCAIRHRSNRTPPIVALVRHSSRVGRCGTKNILTAGTLGGWSIHAWHQLLVSGSSLSLVAQFAPAAH